MFAKEANTNPHVVLLMAFTINFTLIMQGQYPPGGECYSVILFLVIFSKHIWLAALVNHYAYRKAHQ